jgi:catechol 2,3-dioxygenase-like lactoylglutathione lyase family enzyme
MARLNYVTVGTNKPDEAKVFYDALLGSIKLGKLFDLPEGSRLYGSFDDYVFGLMVPHDNEVAMVGNDGMAAFALDSRDDVAAFHALAVSLGGTCEGLPGLSGPEEMGAYFSYFRDLDGNKLCAYRFG